jgi:STAS-like domain of unknown function (DUF4325)
MSEIAKEISYLKLSDFGSLLLTRDQGEPIRNRLMELLQQHGTVEIMFDGVEVYTPSFMDEVLGKCLNALGAEQFRSSVILHSKSPQVRKLVNLVLSNRAHGVSP